MQVVWREDKFQPHTYASAFNIMLEALPVEILSNIGDWVRYYFLPTCQKTDRLLVTSSSCSLSRPSFLEASFHICPTSLPYGQVSCAEWVGTQCYRHWYFFPFTQSYSRPLLSSTYQRVEHLCSHSPCSIQSLCILQCFPYCWASRRGRHGGDFQWDEGTWTILGRHLASVAFCAGLFETKSSSLTPVRFLP